MCDKEQLYDIRSHIVDNMSAFKKAYTDKNFVKHYGEIRGEKNKVIPKEFKESGEKEEMIYNKQFYYFGQLPPETVLKDDLDKIALSYYKASGPVKDFFEKALNS